MTLAKLVHALNTIQIVQVVTKVDAQLAPVRPSLTVRATPAKAVQNSTILTVAAAV